VGQESATNAGPVTPDDANSTDGSSGAVTPSHASGPPSARDTGHVRPHERLFGRTWAGIALVSVSLAAGGRAARSLTELARAGLRPFEAACSSVRGAHAALERGQADESCAYHLGKSDLSRAMLRSLTVDEHVPDASRALALRVLRQRAGESIVADTELTSARAGALRRRVALTKIDAIAHTVLGRVDTSPALRREVLHDAASVALAEYARGLALHGLYDDAAPVLEDRSTTVVGAERWRASKALQRIHTQEVPTDAEMGNDDPPAVGRPEPVPPGVATFVLDASLGPDTEASDHAAALFSALVALLHRYPAPERAAWIRTIALHPAVASSEDGDVEAVLMGRPGPPAARAWLAVRLAGATSVSSEAEVSEDGSHLWIRVGAGRVLLAPGALPARGDPPLGRATRIATPDALDVLATLPALSHAVSECSATKKASGVATHGTAHAEEGLEFRSREATRVDTAATGELVADLRARWAGAPGLAGLAATAVTARCVTYGPWPDRGPRP
jgi:hypothetical protein